MPLGLLRILGACLGLLLYLFARRTREVIEFNLRQAALELTTAQAARHAGRGMLEMLWVWFTPQAQVASRCTPHPDDAALLAQALSGVSPTILLTPHLGCFEALAQYIATQTPLTAMYRRPDKAWVAQLVESRRAGAGLTMVPADETGVRALLKTLKNKRTIGILPDQAPRKGEGAWLTWFGRDAYTITLPAKLQARTDAAVYALAALPVAGGWQLICERVQVQAQAAGEDMTLHNTVAINRALEALIRRAPKHYAWTYNRYKGAQNNSEAAALTKPDHAA